MDPYAGDSVRNLVQVWGLSIVVGKQASSKAILRIKEPPTSGRDRPRLSALDHFVDSPW
jgi:hypothetical protein